MVSLCNGTVCQEILHNMVPVCFIQLLLQAGRPRGQVFTCSMSVMLGRDCKSGAGVCVAQQGTWLCYLL